MKVIGYARVSTQAQELNVQIDTINKYCDENEHMLMGIFKEKVSAVKNRPEWDRVMSNVKNNNVDAVIFLRSDRVARSLKHLLEIVETFKKYNVEMVSIKESMFNDLNSPQGKLIVSIMGALAEFERNLLLMRIQEGRERAILMGTKSGKPMHRPAINIDWEKYDEMVTSGIPKVRICKNLEISKSALYEHLKNRQLKEL